MTIIIMIVIAASATTGFTMNSQLGGQFLAHINDYQSLDVQSNII